MIFRLTILAVNLLIFSSMLYGQDSVNCFLNDFQPKSTSIPLYEDVTKTESMPTVYVTTDAADTLGAISNYIFGNAFPSWLGNVTTDATLLKYLKEINLSLIRYPGGSWSDIFFWDGKAVNIPPTVWDGSNNKWTTFYPQLGKNTWVTTVDNYYKMRSTLGTQGLITINYGYARYGTSDDPVSNAAHYAADWVRYDNGRTKFWEIGNENGGPWEAGWKIDTSLNKDGQPEIISGPLYGEHFKIFADSMRAAANETGAKIYIGCQILHFDGTNDWNVADHNWNQGVFAAVGDSPDFYVMHNYFGNNATTLKGQVDNARSEIIKNINFIRQDIAVKHAVPRPVALTEWNCGGPQAASISIANGLQAVVLFSEMIKNNFGMSSRWTIATGDGGLLYDGSDPNIPRWNPRPDYFFIYYLENFTGDHTINTAVSGSSDILAYATMFHSGQQCVVIVNKGLSDQIIKLLPRNYGYGSKFYVYTLTGGDNTDFSQTVFVNDEGPISPAWGPITDLHNLKAYAYSTYNDINLNSPANSVEYVMIESGNNVLATDKGGFNPSVLGYYMMQNYPNPFNPATTISYQLPKSSVVTLKIFDTLGKEVACLVNKETQSAGRHSISFNASNLSSGIYFYILQTGDFSGAKKMTLLK